jgi:hypothetical protein
MRHLQPKASHVGAATTGASINVELAKKPRGCVFWMFFDQETLEFRHVLWFGQTPGERLASLDRYKTGTHNTRNAHGIKTERPKIRYPTKAMFTRLDTIEDVVMARYGDLRARDLETLANMAEVETVT